MGSGEREGPPGEGGQQRLGEFRIERKLGHGAMGEVYLAWQESLGRLVALKVLRPHLTRSELQVARFKREATAAARLKHPGIVQIYAVGQEGETHYFAMEFIEGTNLQEQERESKGAVDIRRCARVAQEVAEALAYAHAHGVIHRDVKPQNVLMGTDGRVRLVDFGLAKDFAELSLSRSGDIAGTPYYMSPEQALAKRVKVDHRTDVFSLGVVLYEMLSQRRPFEGETSQEVLYQITFKTPRPLRAMNARVPVDLAVICEKAMEKNPADRYATAGDLADDLRRFLAGESIVARPPTPAQRAARFLKRHRLAVSTATAAVFALAAGIGIARGLGHGPELPRVSIVGDDAGARVFARRVDLSSARVDAGAPIELGTVPVRESAIPPGTYRIVVERPGVGFAELTEQFEINDPPRELRESVRKTGDVTSDGMRIIPAGTFVYGLEGDTRPQARRRIESLPEFWIDDHEVSNREYRVFVEATRHSPPWYWERAYKAEWDDLPVASVTRLDATAFARWRGKRLPTSLEWERAARGTDGRMLPWGDREPPSGACIVWSIGPRERATTAEQNLEDYERSARPVRSCPESRGPHGLFHALGNVAELSETAALTPSDGSGRPIRGMCILKGGSWHQSLNEGSLQSFTAMPEGERSLDIGFRCAKSVEP